MQRSPRAWNTIAILAVTQVLSWGTLYYAFAILARDIGRALGLRAELVFGAFSWSLLVGGLVATPTGILRAPPARLHLPSPHQEKHERSPASGRRRPAPARRLEGTGTVEMVAIYEVVDGLIQSASVQVSNKRLDPD